MKDKKFKKQKKTKRFYFDNNGDWALLLIFGIFLPITSRLELPENFSEIFITIGILFLILYIFRHLFYKYYIFINRFWITLKTPYTRIVFLPIKQIKSIKFVKKIIIIEKINGNKEAVSLENISENKLNQLKAKLYNLHVITETNSM